MQRRGRCLFRLRRQGATLQQPRCAIRGNGEPLFNWTICSPERAGRQAAAHAGPCRHPQSPSDAHRTARFPPRTLPGVWLAESDRSRQDADRCVRVSPRPATRRVVSARRCAGGLPRPRPRGVCPFPRLNIPATPRKNIKGASGMSRSGGSRSKPSVGAAASHRWSMKTWSRTWSTGEMMIWNGVTHCQHRSRKSDRRPVEDEVLPRPPPDTHSFALRRAVAAFWSAARAPSRYAAEGGPNQVVSASERPSWVRSPTQAT